MEMVLVVNALVSASTVFAALIALIRPAMLVKTASDDGGVVVFARLYASRAIPLGIVAGFLPFWSRDASVVWMLAVAAVAQVADVTIGFRSRLWGMVGGGAFAMIGYAITAVALAR